MQSLRELIERHSDENSEFRYYIGNIEKAERNEIDHPDVTIECCAALFQGIAKTIVKRLDPEQFGPEFENLSIGRQVKAALRCLAAGDATVELAFPVAAENLVRVVGELRNQRGDISHGRVVPKELQSDRSLARLVLNLTEPLLRYMLATFFALQPERPVMPDYDDNAGFNSWLDDQNAVPGRVLYSRALYDQYPEDYLIQLKDYLDQSAEFEADGTGEGLSDDAD
ncbi:hypothetical protein [Phenylobacterium soli]|uniref:Abortive infection protein-like C-terminal domain-containing protein n=1 Tax=Phenylobacterium soli TaxID=2170551 RepID=A0A328AMY0_9CAUL|nr:hypothetical protein [Phenylobacterium soli]RAK55897.1 hypothetical protein DJ017_15975 [Phenylobacterium soli]